MASSAPDAPDHNERRAVLDAFAAFRDEIDEHNDRRERLIKCSRDITALSKKVVFLLHRIANEEPARATADADGHEAQLLAQVGAQAQDRRAINRKAARKGYDKLREIQAMFAGLRDELAGDRFWRYQPNVTPGLQEYIEALSFAHYLEHGTLIAYDEVQHSLSDADGNYFTLPAEDYLLGVSDLTGELMRFAITSITKRGGRTIASEICSFVRGCHADFQGFTPFVRELRGKQRTTASSLVKIEDAAYAVAIRTSEFDLPPHVLDDIVSRSVSGMSRGDAGGGRRDADDGYDDD